MSVEVLSRAQFALNIAFHYFYPPLSIGLGLGLVLMEALFLKTKKRLYEDMMRFWVKIFALIFAMGVATGLVQVFGFGTNWARFSRFVGDVFGSALGAEGIFAFFLEAGFLGILLFGWEKVSRRLHFFSTCCVCFGAHFSALWIVIANSWMQTPAGYTIVGEGVEAHAVITDFWKMVFNPSAVDRICHVILGCWLAGAFLIISVSAFYLLRRRHLKMAWASLRVGLAMGLVSLLLQFFSGDSTSRGVAVNQPIKLAAMEGVFSTGPSTPIHLWGIVDTEEHKVEGWHIPGLLSLLIYRDFSVPVKGLDAFPKEDWPNVQAVFQFYHLMVALWVVMLVTVVGALFLWKKQKLAHSKGWLRLLILSVLFPQIANQAGWFTAEMGRQPWIVYGVMRTSQGLSHTLSQEQVIGSITMFVAIYLLLFALFLYLLNQKIQHGPQESVDQQPLYANRLLERKSS